MRTSLTVFKYVWVQNMNEHICISAKSEQATQMDRDFWIIIIIFSTTAL